MPLRDDGVLVGKVLIVTGASRGIGAAAARLFALRGATVVAAARGEQELATVVAEIQRAAGRRRPPSRPMSRIGRR